METTADPITTTHVDDPRDEIAFDEPTTERSWSFSSEIVKAFLPLVALYLVIGFVVMFDALVSGGNTNLTSGEPQLSWWSFPLFALCGILVARFCMSTVVVSERGLRIRRTFKSYDVPWSLAVVACLAEAYRRYRKRRAGC